MKNLLSVLAGGMALASLLILTGCNDAAAANRGGVSLQVGSECTIQFRRDALGAAAAVPVPPMTGSINGAETAVRGNIITVNPEWIAIQEGRGQLWIPQASVLLVQVHEK